MVVIVSVFVIGEEARPDKRFAFLTCLANFLSFMGDFFAAGVTTFLALVLATCSLTNSGSLANSGSLTSFFISVGVLLSTLTSTSVLISVIVFSLTSSAEVVGVSTSVVISTGVT
jgi:hypothetical protein